MSAEPNVENGPVRIILIDDTVDVREMLRLMLAGEPAYRVVGEAGDGAEGVRLAVQLQPDVILLDMAMPVMDGLEALPHLRRGCPRAKILVFSGFAPIDLERPAREGGADGYITKGAKRQQIIDAIERALKG